MLPTHEKGTIPAQRLKLCGRPPTLIPQLPIHTSYCICTAAAKASLVQQTKFLTTRNRAPTRSTWKLVGSSKLLSAWEFPFGVVRLNEQRTLGRFVLEHRIRLPTNAQINSSYEASNTKVNQVPSNNRTRQTTSPHRLDSTLRKFQKAVPYVPAKCCY